MRDALKESIAASRAETERYPHGSIVICVSCGRPLFWIEGGIAVGAKAGDMAQRLKPITPRLLKTICDRADVNAGLRAWVKAQSWPALIGFCERIPQPKAGDPCLCPQCGHVWVESRTAEVSDTLDRAHVLELHIIPPAGPTAPMKPTDRGAKPRIFLH